MRTARRASALCRNHERRGCDACTDADAGGAGHPRGVDRQRVVRRCRALPQGRRRRRRGQCPHVLPSAVRFPLRTLYPAAVRAGRDASHARIRHHARRPCGGRRVVTRLGAAASRCLHAPTRRHHGRGRARLATDRLAVSPAGLLGTARRRRRLPGRERGRGAAPESTASLVARLRRGAHAFQHQPEP